MNRRTLLKSGLAIGAAASLGGSLDTASRVFAAERRKTGSLSWWSWGDPSLKPGVSFRNNSPYDAVKVLYQRSHPGMILNTTTYNYPDYTVALKTAFASGSEPDTVQLEPGPLLGLYEPFLLSVEEAAAAKWGPNWRSLYYPAALVQVLNADPAHKTMYGLPMANEVGNALYYNTQIFARYNLRPPQSYADLKGIADVLNSHSIIPIAWGAKDLWPNFDWYVNLVQQTGPQEWQAAISGKAKFTSPPLVQPLQILDQMQKDKIFSPNAWGTTAYNDAITLFGTGKAAMYSSGSWDFATFMPMPVAKHIGIFPIPPMAPGLKRGRMWSSSAVIVCATKAAKDPAAALEFVTWYGGPAGQQATWVNIGYFIPTRKDVHPAHLPNPQFQAIQRFFLSELPRTVLRYGNPPVSAAMQRAIEDAISAVLVNGQSPAKAMSSVQAVFDREHHM
jgi:raffinose/stachyose/melibiose transport system substrate-binding protein